MRNVTFYFPRREPETDKVWTIYQVRVFLLTRGHDWTRFRLGVDGQTDGYTAELQGSEQHERTENFYG